MDSVRKPPVHREADAARAPGVSIMLGGFDTDGCYRPTVHPGTTVVNTGDLIDLYAIIRLFLDLLRGPLDDRTKRRLLLLAGWFETMLLGALAGDNPEYEGWWFDTVAGCWRDPSEGRS